jgi:hypothetical protein
MATKKPTAKTATAPATAPATVTLAQLVAATLQGATMPVDRETAAPWLAAGFAETNPTDTSPTPETRATAAGIAHMQGTSTMDTQPAVAPRATASKFEIDTDVAAPDVNRSRAGAAKYPFDQLEVGHSFHIPATDEEPNPTKAYASTVTSATNRYSVVDPAGGTKMVDVKEYQRDADGKRMKNADGSFIVLSVSQEERPLMVQKRKFVIRPVGADDKRGPGARVFRVEPDSEPY